MDSKAGKTTIREQILIKTKRTLSIETSPTPSNLAKCNPQLQSPLFSKLPQELRDLIWEFASTQDEDIDKKYPETAFYYRPDYRAPLRTSTSHLLTCRWVWLEANALPLRQASLPIWLMRGPYDLTPTPRNWQTAENHEVSRWNQKLKGMTSNNVRAVTNIHLFTQLFALQRLATESDLLDVILKSAPGLRPTSVRITVRQADWWSWERADPLQLDGRFILDILQAPQMAGVLKLSLELEVEESKKDELATLVETLIIDGHDEHGQTFVCDPTPRWTQWARSPRLGDKDWTLFEGMSELRMHVAELNWRNTNPRSPASAATSAPETASTPYQQNSALHTLADARTYIHRTRFARGNAFELGLWRLAMQKRHQARRLSADQWRGLGMEYQNAVVWFDSVDLANQQMKGWREGFERGMGDFEARRMVRGWEEQGSLLKFEGWDEME